MLHKSGTRWLGLTAVLVVFASAASVFAQTGGLTGTVKDENGNHVVGYPIIIERLEIKGTYKTKTDKRGTYVYIGLSVGNYKVTLQDPAGRTLYSFNNVHVGLGDATTLDFDLAKEKAAVKKEMEANPQYQKQVEEQAKEEKQLGNLKQVYEEGRALQAQQKYQEAAAKFEESIPLAKGPNLVIVLQAAAGSYRQARLYEKALDLYQKALQLQPNDASLYDGLGNVYADMRKIPEAQQAFQKAAELNPAGASREYYNLGAILYNQGKMDEAAAAFKKASDVDPTFADAFLMQGRALMGKMTMSDDGKVVAAPGTAEALEAYLKLEPNGKYSAEAQAMLQTIQGKVETQYKAPKKKKG